ncbi:hypothetical protein Q5752_001481 [Cryptotrichosporon argae]
MTYPVASPAAPGQPPMTSTNLSPSAPQAHAIPHPRAEPLRRVLSSTSTASTSGSATPAPTSGASVATTSAPLSPAPGSPARTPRAQRVKEVKGEQLAADLDHLVVRSPVESEQPSALAAPAASPGPASAPVVAMPVPVPAAPAPAPLHNTLFSQHIVESPPVEIMHSNGILGIGANGNGNVANGDGPSPALAGGSSPSAPIDIPAAAPRRGNTARSASTSTESSSSRSVFHLPSNFGSMYDAEGFPAYPAGSDEAMPTGSQRARDEQIALQIAQADEAIKQLNGTASVIHAPKVAGVPAYLPPPMAGGTASNGIYDLPRGFANFTRPQTRDEHAVTRQSSTSSTTTEASTSSEESDLCIPSIEWVNVNVPGAGAGAGVGKMMPPPGRGFNSPRRPSVPHTTSIPFGGSASTPSGLSHSALPLPPAQAHSFAPSTDGDDDDDDHTVGHGREGSPSTASSASGLDLLWQATRHSQSGPSGLAGEHKRKAGAGADAVAQWRASSGMPSGRNSEARDSVCPPGSASTERDGGPPRKRRRSEHGSARPDRADIAMTPTHSAGAHPFARHSRTPDVGSEDSVDDDDDDADADEADSDDASYAANRPRRQRKPSAKKAAAVAAAGGGGGGGGGATRKGRRSDPLTMSPGTPGPSAAAGLASAFEDAHDSAGLATAGGGGGGSKTHPVGHGTVRCEYVNPLPPYQQCTDVFTRKYDLPRHMARHARREGELVAEGKLAEDKAVLWRTIKDKPKVECKTCGESFTSQKAQSFS